MSCKDCLHYEVCDCAGEYQYPQGYCKFFKDKSEWVHLPCKVGNTVYCFAPCFDEKRQPKIRVTETKVVDIKTIATVPGMEFNVEKIGKTVFLTRDEAEKELEERKKSEND